MKIIKIKINNFKTFDSEEIMINKHLNYFVGINGVGKSNFLKAIEIFGNDEADFHKNAKNHNKDIDISFELQLNSENIESIIKLVIEDWLNYLSLFLKDLEKENNAINKINIEENILLRKGAYKRRILSENFTKKFKIENNENEIDYFKIKSCVRNDLSKIEKLNENFIEKFSKKILQEFINQFENENFILIKKISKEEKSSVLASNILSIFNNIIFSFSDLFKIETLDNEKIFLINKKGGGIRAFLEIVFFEIMKIIIH